MNVLPVAGSFLQYGVLDLHPVQFFNEWGSDGYAELPGQEFNVPSFFRVMKEH